MSDSGSPSESDCEEVNHCEVGRACSTLQDTSETSLLSRFPNELPYDIGQCDDPCKMCGALHWKLERTQRMKLWAQATYSTCCQQGAVALPSDHLENDLTPPFLQNLFTRQDKNVPTEHSKLQ
ncbi:uncharacterized protein MELLADRAFT_110583 [Melampsora larici-populina 98AG31]|uniref:Uncharacterized protein n=1 Tax=Melampsora larici-populina (strain 98AG31 / pathotype 3-4-7) TaxID=747676 RepID=F4S0A1_MELLP|nr:uncharacterized protein MELLADRAFT_110583 [Melampsora larici-populina 98AG31]EGG01927.1 hypothetical protein MELLADRAFT_110583 [Melampsora larici-populina 98AG31]